MSDSCSDVEQLIGRPLPALSEAERLQLEQHLSQCAACRRVSALSRSITTLVLEAPSALSPASRERALTGAFARVGEPRVARLPARRGLRLAGGMVLAAVVLLGLRVVWLERAPGELARATEPVEVGPAAVLPQTDHLPLPQATEVPAPAAWIDVASAETRTFAHAQVALAAGTRVRFDAASNALELARGRVDVDVDASRGVQFAVVTQAFRVQVLGTMFAVTPERVEVQRGHVQVRASDGAWLARDLGPGQSFELALGRHAARPRPERHTHESARALLQQARSALAQADVEAARALIERAEPRSRRPSERAEVGTLRAECALLERRPAEAVRAYLSVAERFARLQAGENALFAAAQLSARSAPRAAATRALLDRYLERYPHGRFADEVRTRQGQAAER